MSGVLKKVVLSAMDSALVKSKFRGCILGSFLGDCLGSPYKGEETLPGDRITIQRYFDTLETSGVLGPKRGYTDGTAMTKCVAKCLIDKLEIDDRYLAKLLVKEYYDEPKRGYGENVVDVFKRLKEKNFGDIYKLAREQFGGTGSFGNGGAMRVAPIALYYHDNYDNMIAAARKTAEITHTHKLGVNGALLQCIAINQALYYKPEEKIDPHKFCDMLMEKIKPIETTENVLGLKRPEPKPYYSKLNGMKRLLSAQFTEEYDQEVIATLGNSITAVDSVVTAILCFLKAQTAIPRIETDNIFRRTIQYAITLGGDSDTIASMAGAIAGAYVGEESLNKNTLQYCEFSKEMMELADNLYERTFK